MNEELKGTEGRPVLELQRGNWWERIGWMAQRAADRLIPGCSEIGEPALVPVVAPERSKIDMQHRN